MLCGIDPGAQGAIAWLSDCGTLVEVLDLPHVEVKGRRKLIPAALAQMLQRPGRRPLHVFVEEVGVRPGEGAVGAFSFGMGYGQITGVLAALGVPLTLVRPTIWKRDLKLGADKGEARMRACQLWPGAAEQFRRVKDDGRAEAALIGLYGSGVLQGAGKCAA